MTSIDTIAAIATPPVPSAIGIIRVSGSSVGLVVQQLFKLQPHKIKPREMVTRYIYSSDGKPLDECCFVMYEGPRSYTGEDVLEIFTHGSIYILNQVIQEICKLDDCRLAKNGEFTQRAFLNGKLSLSKAESIIDIIESNSETSHEIALNQYQGHVYKTIRTFRTELITILEKIEASLEFPDEVGAIQETNVLNELNTIHSELSKIIYNSDYGVLMKKGLKLLIIGAPNVGKSSLLNCLSGENRSIISNIPGTTRDYIDITIEYKGMLINLIDTAGIRETSNEVESMGINKITDLSTSADGFIHVKDATDILDSPLPSEIDTSKPIITVYNKIDQLTSDSTSKKTPNSYNISCKTKAGIQDLKDALLASFFNKKAFEPAQMLSNIRQITALKRTNILINQAINNIRNHQTLDIIAIDIREAIHHASNIFGEDFTEELLDGIFENFCIGK
ncbi:MAG: tRNA uridine-5-carboxymethylaminomethyl(34) synthesis GTPase MnmE [Candidatus Margulisiibacteriota bacterium]